MSGVNRSLKRKQVRIHVIIIPRHCLGRTGCTLAAIQLLLLYAIMGKRRRVESDDEFFQDEGDSDYGSSVKKRKAVPRKQLATVAEPSNAEYSNDHSKSQHVISNADEICDALLRWYSGVHATRGMPWRKEYDPNLGPEERAQRAYEVSFSTCFLFIPSV